MTIIPFPFPVKDNDAFDEFMDTLPDIDELDAGELDILQQKVEALIDQLDNSEPKNQKSEAYEDWAEKHEDLEDVLDEILDRLEEL